MCQPLTAVLYFCSQAESSSVSKPSSSSPPSTSCSASSSSHHAGTGSSTAKGAGAATAQRGTGVQVPHLHGQEREHELNSVRVGVTNHKNLFCNTFWNLQCLGGSVINTCCIPSLISINKLGQAFSYSLMNQRSHEPDHAVGAPRFASRFACHLALIYSLLWLVISPDGLQVQTLVFLVIPSVATLGSSCLLLRASFHVPSVGTFSVLSASHGASRARRAARSVVRV